MPMEPSIEQGVAYELHYLFNEKMQTGWQFVIDNDRFVAVPPLTLTAQDNFAQLLEQFVLEVSSFVAYGHYVSIERRADGGYTMRSSLDSGNGYQIDFEPVHRHLANPYQLVPVQ
jgi:hypothetical protein